MESELFVGLDVHKKTVVATAVDREGNRVDQSSFGPRDSELISYLDGLPGRKHVVLEACNVWEHYYDAASSTDAEVTLAHPYRVRFDLRGELEIGQGGFGDSGGAPPPPRDPRGVCSGP